MMKPNNHTTTPTPLWTKDYMLGIKEIDTQHEKFVKTLANLYEALRIGEGGKTLNSTFKELFNYIKYHFATEEKYFDKFNYEGAEEHKKEHKRFKEKINSFVKEKTEDNYKISIDLLDFMEDWLIEHIDLMDKKYVKCFKDSGLK